MVLAVPYRERDYTTPVHHRHEACPHLEEWKFMEEKYLNYNGYNRIRQLIT